jgi:hypothetical protein
MVAVDDHLFFTLVSPLSETSSERVYFRDVWQHSCLFSARLRGFVILPKGSARLLGAYAACNTRLEAQRVGRPGPCAFAFFQSVICKNSESLTAE